MTQQQFTDSLLRLRNSADYQGMSEPEQQGMIESVLATELPGLVESLRAADALSPEDALAHRLAGTANWLAMHCYLAEPGGELHGLSLETIMELRPETANPLPDSLNNLIEHIRWWVDPNNPSGEIPHDDLDEWWYSTYGTFFPWEAL